MMLLHMYGVDEERIIRNLSNNVMSTSRRVELLKAELSIHENHLRLFRDGIKDTIDAVVRDWNWYTQSEEERQSYLDYLTHLYTLAGGREPIKKPPISIDIDALLDRAFEHTARKVDIQTKRSLEERGMGPQ